MDNMLLTQMATIIVAEARSAADPPVMLFQPVARAAQARVNVVIMTDQEHDAFMRGFDLAQPPGPDEADALDRAEEVLPVDGGQLRVAVSIEVAKAIRAETDRLPEHLSGPTWLGFLRGTIAKAGMESGGPVHVHKGGRA